MADDVIHIAIPATGEYRKWAEVTAASAVFGSSLPVKVHYIDWTVIDRQRLERLGSWHGSAIAFSRLFLAELFPALDWIITCDADVLFRGDIAELWALRDDAVSFIAHKDCPLPPHPYTQSHYDWYKAHKMVIKDWSSYFADGLGLVNLKRWREKGYQAEFERLAKTYNDWPSPDMMILNYVLQNDKKLLPVEWDCFSGDENADVDWSKSGAVHFVEDTPWRRYKITHLASDLVEEWWKIADRIGVAAKTKGFRGCRNWFDWAWRRAAFVCLKHNQWILKMHWKLWLHLRSTRGINAMPSRKVDDKSFLHIVPGLDNPFNGIAVAAKLIAGEQAAEMVDAREFGKIKDLAKYEEVWVHSCWLPATFKACWRVVKAKRPLVRMAHANLDPVRLRYHSWKKWLVGPIERWALRRCEKIVATCDAEKGWIEAYLGKKCPEIVVTDVKRFFKLNHEIHERHEKKEELGDSAGGSFDLNHGIHGIRGKGDALGVRGQELGDRYLTHKKLNVLYLGRRHPLKGVEYLEEAVKELGVRSQGLGVRDVENNSKLETLHLELKIVSNAFGEELEKVWDWCDVLVLPTLSENFGLVVAEALERGKRVITTDGAPAWGEGLELRVESGGVEEFRVGSGGVGSEIWSGYEGRLIYLKGYRDGTPQERVRLLKSAITAYLPNILHKCDRFDLSPRTNGKSKCSETRPMGAGRR